MLLVSYAKEHSIYRFPHADSEECKKCDLQMADELLEITKKLVLKMAKKLNKSEKETEYLLEIVSSKYSEEKQAYLTNFIKEYGIENLISLISSMNEEFLMSLETEKNSSLGKEEDKNITII